MQRATAALPLPSILEPGGRPTPRRCAVPGQLYQPAHQHRRRLVTTAAAWSPLGRQAQNRLFIFGLGYTGLGAACYFQSRGWLVAGTCRTQEKCERLSHHGIQTYHFDPSEWENLSGKGLQSLRHATHVLSTVPPDADNDVDPVIMAHAQQLSEQAEAYRWVGYISSTSVYGDYEGEWVDESSELRAAGGKGWPRVMAEHEWLALHDNFGLPVHIFRCGGIYGPERSAIEVVERAWAGGQENPSAARRGRQRYTARCHIYDICQTLEASMRHPRPGAAYNVADNDPADRASVLAYASELLQRRAEGRPALDAGRASSSSSSSVPAPAAAAAAAGTAAAGGNVVAVESLQDLVSPLSSVSTSSSSSGSYDSADDLPLGLLLQEQQQPQPQPLSQPRRLPDSSTEVSEQPRGGGSRTQVQRWQRQRQRGRAGGAAGPAQRQLDEKRVSNQLIKQELGVRLAFPTYREGLSAIAAGDTRPFDL